MVTLYTGLRYTDLTQLTGEHVSADGGWLDVRPTKTRRHGITVRIPLHPAVKPIVGMLAASIEDGDWGLA